jgi:molybdopterin/thiamine biosynthesis adenylyltransferase
MKSSLWGIKPGSTMSTDSLVNLSVFLQEEAQGDLLPWAAQVSAAKRFSLSLAEVEEAALDMGLLPARYQRNRATISTVQQLQLFRSRVVVIGCGGLGGYIIEELARLGVGELVCIDPDVFEEHNLNRQLLSTPGALNNAKVEVAAARVRTVNPAVTVSPRQTAFTRGTGPDLLRGATVVMDGLDNFPARLELLETCRDMALPLVHGAIGGWYGRVASQLPGDDISPLVSGLQEMAKGVEATLGNPSFTPAVVASLQVAEACKIILGQGHPLRHRILFIDLLEMKIEEIGLRPTSSMP